MKTKQRFLYKGFSISTLAMFALSICVPSYGATVVRVIYENNTGGAADDFHINVSNSGGSAVGNRRLTNAGVNTQNPPTNGWTRTRRGLTNTSADFDKGTGAAVAAGARGDFFVQNNTNYLKITSAYWTNGGIPFRDAEGKIIEAKLIGQNITEYASSFSSNGAIEFNPFTTDPINFQFMLVRTGVSFNDLELLTDPDITPSPTFSDFDALVGTTLFRDDDGGVISGLQSYIGPSISQGMGAFIYIGNDQGDYVVLGSDAKNVPEPNFTLCFFAIGTLGAASTLKRKLKPSKKDETLVS